MTAPIACDRMVEVEAAERESMSTVLTTWRRLFERRVP